MNLDFGRAFSYIFEDEAWQTKLGIAALIQFFGSWLLGIPLLLLGGYSVAIAHNVRKGVDRLPEWDDLGTLFKDGLYIFLARLVYAGPFLVLLCVALIGTVGLGNLSEMSEDAAAAGIFATFGLTFCLALLFAAAYVFIGPAVIIQYVRTGEFAACFRFAEVFAIARENIANILLIVALVLGGSMALGTVSGVFTFIPCIGLFIAWGLGVAFGVVMLAALGHLYGQMSIQSPGGAA